MHDCAQLCGAYCDHAATCDLLQKQYELIFCANSGENAAVFARAGGAEHHGLAGASHSSDAQAPIPGPQVIISIPLHCNSIPVGPCYQYRATRTAACALHAVCDEVFGFMSPCIHSQSVPCKLSGMHNRSCTARTIPNTRIKAVQQLMLPVWV